MANIFQTSDPNALVVGVLLLGPGVQLLDVSGADLLAMMSPEYLRACHLPEQMVSMGIPSKFHYISEDGPSKPFPMTAGVRYVPTDDLGSCPQLDILLVGGPHPDYVPSPAVKGFLRMQLESGKLKALLTVCTGILPILQTNLLYKKKASGPRSLVPMLKKQFPDTTFEERRWVKDFWGDGGKQAAEGNRREEDNEWGGYWMKGKTRTEIWTSGGITNGLDMIAGFMRENFPSSVTEWVLDTADIGGRGQYYVK